VVPDAAFFDRIPTEPGVYLMKDRAGRVIYVGKAVNLRARVKQYFHGGDERFFVAAGLLGRALADLEWMVVGGEKEALLLENHLIKKHQPRFNVKLRDDKQYLVLRIDPKARFPRVEVVRNIREDGARYFGPYHSASSARQTLRTLNRHFQLRTCTDHVLDTRVRPCLQYQIKRCPGPCVFPVDPAAYAEQVEDVCMFLAGKNQELVARLRARMAEKSAAEQFEAAGHLRDSLAAVERSLGDQNVVQDQFVDQDVFGMWRDGDVVEAVVLFVRSGKLVGRRNERLREQEQPDAAVMAAFVQQYYASGTPVPDEVVLPFAIDDHALLSDWLGGLRGARVRLIAARRGVRRKLAQMAEANARAAGVAADSRDADTRAALDKLAARLELKRPPRRIECFDIAHIQGAATVGSMVVFVDGVPERAHYRHFKVKGAGNDDFASMYEVLTRRFRRGLDGGDPAWALPDLLVIDGGKGQLGTALAALADLGIEIGENHGFDVVALAKERENTAGDTRPDRVFLRNRKDPVQLRPNTTELFLLSRVRDEAHRFANTFHRKQRSSRTLRSALDDVPGIGAARRRALLRHFGSVKAIRAATVDQLAAVPGMSRPAATALHAWASAGTGSGDPGG